MWEATTVIVLAALAAAVVAAVLLRAHAPEQGYRTWVLEAFRSASASGRGAEAAEAAESAEATESRWWAEPSDTEDMEVADLFALSEPGAGYEVAPDLREMMRRRHRRN